MLQGRTQPHALVVVNEIVGRLHGNPVEELANGPEGRGLAGLVPAVDHVQPVAACREVEHLIGEGTERIQLQLEDLHRPDSDGERRFLSRASTSSRIPRSQVRSSNRGESGCLKNSAGSLSRSSEKTAGFLQQAAVIGPQFAQPASNSASGPCSASADQGSVLTLTCLDPDPIRAELQRPALDLRRRSGPDRRPTRSWSLHRPVSTITDRKQLARAPRSSSRDSSWSAAASNNASSCRSPEAFTSQSSQRTTSSRRNSRLDQAVVQQRSQVTTLGAGFADVPSLDVAGIDDVRIGADDRALVNVSQRPVVVSLVPQTRERAGGVAIVAFRPLDAGVQQADVEVPAHGRRIIPRQILGHGPGREPLTVDHDPEVLQAVRLRLLGTQHRDVRRKPQRPGHPVGRVVVARNHEDPDPGLVQPGHLLDEVKPGVVVGPVPIIDVARQEHKGDLLADRQLDQVLEGSATRGANPLHRRSLVTLKPVQPAVQMEIRGVKKLDHGHLAEDPGGRETSGGGRSETIPTTYTDVNLPTFGLVLKEPFELFAEARPRQDLGIDHVVRAQVRRRRGASPRPSPRPVARQTSDVDADQCGVRITLSSVEQRIVQGEGLDWRRRRAPRRRSGGRGGPRSAAAGRRARPGPR